MTEDELLDRCVPVPFSGCWLFEGALDGRGYARVMYQGHRVRLHRLALAMRLGRPLQPHEHACHTCDIPFCCNPNHLFVGTNRDNAADRVRKGRQVNRPKALSLDHVDVARKAYGAGASVKQIALVLGVTEKHTQKILSGRRWRRK